MQEYIKGEVFKYIPMEGDTINKLYVGRIDTAYALFTTVLEIAPFFPLIHNKLGALDLFKLLLKGEAADAKDEAKFKYHMDRAFEVFTKFGLKHKGGKL